MKELTKRSTAPKDVEDLLDEQVAHNHSLKLKYPLDEPLYHDLPGRKSLHKDEGPYMNLQLRKK